MKQLNYHHLHYFYLVAKEGSIAKACKLLHVTPQTVSGQIAILEDYLGLQLFERRGKRLVLSDNGKQVYGYAQDIFNLGHELMQSLEPNQINQKMTFSVGITDVIPKVYSFQLLEPLFFNEQAFKLNCKEGALEQLLTDMTLNRLDMILADRPIPHGFNIKAYSHKVLSCGLTFYIAKSKSNSLVGDFPASLDKQDLLIPGDQSSLKHSMLAWFEQQHIQPNIVAEFDDSALCKLFGQAGVGIFTTPSVIEEHVLSNFEVEIVGRCDEILEHIYMITTERKIKHPALLTLKSAMENKTNK